MIYINIAIIIEFIKSWEGLVVTNRTMEMFRAILKKASEK